jgi:hypothetical protein
LFCCAKPTAAEAKSVKAIARFMAMPPQVRLKDKPPTPTSPMNHRDAEDLQFSIAN